MTQTPDLVLDRIPSPLGALFVVEDADGVVRALDFEDDEARMRRLLDHGFGAGRARPRPGSASARLRTGLERYFAGEFTALDAIPAEGLGTEFQTRVWAALRDIPPGHTETYGGLATRIGRPTAVRAVGLANGANPIAILVPCHRVIGANGGLTGYGGGLSRKRWLLSHEGARFSAASPARAGATRATRA